MHQRTFIKIGDNGEQLSADATHWAAVLLPEHGLMFTATHVAANVPHAECEAACAAASVAGFTDWTLPDVDQLQLVVDRTRHSPAVDPAFFRGIESDWYWTSTPAAWSSSAAWYVFFYDGYVNGYRRVNGGFALAVRRAGQ